MRRVPALLAATIGLVAATTALADDAADRAAIVDRLNRFTEAFNAIDGAGICDLFAADLVAIVPGNPDGTRETLCANLDKLLGNPEIQLHYDYPEVREIILAGDIAVVRPVWTLTARRGNEEDQTTEYGIDIFARQPDGRWSISRFSTFTDRPNRVLD